jgi:hypothetical protein
MNIYNENLKLINMQELNNSKNIEDNVLFQYLSSNDLQVNKDFIISKSSYKEVFGNPKELRSDLNAIVLLFVYPKNVEYSFNNGYNNHYVGIFFKIYNNKLIINSISNAKLNKNKEEQNRIKEQINKYNQLIKIKNF